MLSESLNKRDFIHCQLCFGVEIHSFIHYNTTCMEIKLQDLRFYIFTNLQSLWLFLKCTSLSLSDDLPWVSLFGLMHVNMAWKLNAGFFDRDCVNRHNARWMNDFDNFHCNRKNTDISTLFYKQDNFV